MRRKIWQKQEMKEQIKLFNKLVEENNLDLQLVGCNPLFIQRKNGFTITFVMDENVTELFNFVQGLKFGLNRK